MDMGVLFWGFLVLYGVLMWTLSPRTLTLGVIPAAWAIGTGKYALLLGSNLYGLLLCCAGYLLPGLLPRREQA